MSRSHATVPKSAYPSAYSEFDASISMDDSVEGDISLSRDFQPELQANESDSEDSSFEELLESPSTTRKSSIFKEPTSHKPRGYEFKLKKSEALVYLTYPVDSIEIDTYGRIDYELQTKEKSMVLIIPNSRGLSVNNQKLADAYAIRTGCVVALLDVYFNDPLNLETPAEKHNDTSFISKFKHLTVELALNAKLNYWLATHSVFGAFNEGRFQTTTSWTNVEGAIEELLTTHEVENCVVIGFSFGANAAARIGMEAKDDIVKSVVLVHPLGLPENAIELIKSPTLLIVGKEDQFYSHEVLQKYENDIAAKKDMESFKYHQFKLKNDTPHGFAIAGDYSPMKVGDLPTRVCEKIVSWVLKKI